MDRHRVLVHSTRANGERATQEVIDRYRSYGRHKPTAKATATATTASATVTTATAISPIEPPAPVDELTAGEGRVVQYALVHEGVEPASALVCTAFVSWR